MTDSLAATSTAWSREAALAALPALLSGFVITLQIVLVGTAIALVLGLLFAVAARTAPRAPRLAVVALTQALRNTPLLVQVYFLYYFVLPSMSLQASALATGIAAIGQHYASYTAEVYRAGIDNVPRAQWDAARALNLSERQIYRHVILPQALPPMLPALGNYAIAMFKDAPLLSAISVAEVLTQALDPGARSFRYGEVLSLVAVVELGVSLLASALVARLEARVARAGRTA
jgi:polar amino acid transport system permease protein